jgi:L1 cell adhesion molecule like protein
MDHGLLYLNFTDAIAEGDGDRIIRCWKFLLLHFFVDGSNSTKYALEALYLQFQQQSLLSPRQAYCQKWNRSVNNHGKTGKNVYLDLDLEHDNNYLKEAMRKIGAGITEQSVTRICRSLKMAREVIENISRECHVMKRSGMHYTACNEKDLLKMVDNIVQHQALTKINGRRYKTFQYCVESHIQSLDMTDFCKWINKHKEGAIKGRKAR